MDYLNRWSSVIWNNKGYIFFKLERFDEALNCFNKSLELNSRNSVKKNMGK